MAGAPMGGGTLAAGQPRIPAKSPMRGSRDMSREVTRESYLPEHAPVSPIDPPFARRDSGTPPASPRHNFSYPSRSPHRNADPSVRHNPGTVNDLRAAAKGLHVRAMV